MMNRIMRLTLTLLCALCLALTAAAQGRAYTITGLVKDSLSGEPQEYATVRLSHSGKTQPVAVGITDAEGRFKVATSTTGRLDLTVIFIGKTPVTRTVQLPAQSPIDLGTLLMSDAQTTLGEATVTAQRPIVTAEVDRIGYSMKEDPEAQTSSLLDMLRKVPMVEVDGEDNIKVNGNAGFKVYVNGKPNQMMSANPSLILKNYPASAVKKVEVITDPGAKYDAEGVSGILNIVTDAETKTSGYTVTPNFSVGNRDVNGNVFAMVQAGKFTLSANYGVGRHKHPEGTSWSEREAYNDPVNHLLRSDGTTKDNGTFQFGSLDASYEIDAKNLLTVSAGLNSYHGHGTSLTNYRMTAADGTPTYSYNLFAKTRRKWEGYNVSTDYQHTFKKPGQFLTLSYRYNINPGGQRQQSYYSDVVNVPAVYDLTDRYSDPATRSSEHTAQADFTTPIGKAHTLSAGVKYIYRLNSSDNVEMTRPYGTEDAFVVDEAASIDYRHRADIAAAYGEYNLKVGNFSARAGLRYEYSRYEVSYPDGKREGFSTDFNNLVPSVNFGYNFSPSMLLKASYNIRIGRPDISFLSPYVERTTAESQQYGNPNLDAETAHNFTLGFSTFKSKLSINATLAYTLQNDGLTRYSFLDENNIMTTTHGNLLHSKTLALGCFVNWTPIDGTSLNINAEGNYRDYKAYRYHNGANAHNCGFGGGIFGGIRQNLPWKLKLNIHGGGRFGGIELQGTRPLFYFYGVNLGRSFLKEERLTLTVSAGNFANPKRKFRSETYTPTYRFISENETDFMRLSVGVRFRIGSLKAGVKKTSRTITNSDVIRQESSSQSQQESGGM